ncbi:MAG TPA: SIR2 family protein [Solirubrobacterales bacterium]|nr:SIR2 family protein [Solirubrobacterales bacterium]
MRTKIFINYRKVEAAGWARLLYEQLADEFGKENVFLDQVNLEPGEKWLHGIRSGSSGCAAFLALIGPRWTATLAQRAESGEGDFVRDEIETALERGSQVRDVIPVLVEDAELPSKEDLRYVGSLKRLLNHQQLELRPSRWEADVEVLVERLKRPPEDAEEEEKEEKKEEGEEVESEPQLAPAPDHAHYDELAHLLLEEGSLVVPFLGPGTNSCDRTEPWRDVDSAHLPDAEELAAYLAARMGMKATPASLALVSQSLSVAKGPGDLYMALRRALPPQRQPSSVHRFLAGLPATLHGLGAPDRYQLIVTTNYDNALEQAFDEAEEAYDLAVYLARGRDKGKFVHVPHDGEPQLVTDPNSYDGFPIDAFGRVERTVVMKVHGAVDRPQSPNVWRDNYVITEDDYIDYMSDGEIESIVPQQLLGKLRDYSHYLFLGHGMYDWSLRVFLIRVFGDRGQPNTSWAIEREPNRLDERFWQRMGVDLTASPLDTYVQELGSRLVRVAAEKQPQP